MRTFLLLTLILTSSLLFSQNANQTDSISNDSVLQVIKNSHSELESRIDKQNIVIDKIKTELSEKEAKNNSDLTISIISVIIALGLLIITCINNQNNKRILEKQITQQRDINNEQQKIQRAQQRPVVDAYRSGWKEETELIMINYGLGPAVLEEITFEKEGHPPIRTISDLIDIKKIDKDVWWDDKWNYSKKDYYLFPQQKTKLYTVTKKRLMEKYNKSVTEAENIIDKVREAREGITFKVKYVDLISKENKDERIEYNAEIPIYSKKTSG